MRKTLKTAATSIRKAAEKPVKVDVGRPAGRSVSRPKNGFVESFNGRMRDELLNEMLFFTIGQARSILTRWVDDYNNERPNSSLGYATPAAFAADLEQQRAGLTPPVASPALMRDNTGRSLVAAG